MCAPDSEQTDTVALRIDSIEREAISGGRLPSDRSDAPRLHRFSEPTGGTISRCAIDAAMTPGWQDIVAGSSRTFSRLSRAARFAKLLAAPHLDYSGRGDGGVR